jgi:glycine dehydrogenase
MIAPTDTFARRHLGPNSPEQAHMLEFLGVASLEELMEQTVPANIRLNRNLDLPAPLGEAETIADLRQLANQNQRFRSFIGMGYYNTHVPAVIKRNILENPGWYTAYTPYQAEISQGRMAALLNYQTMICDLTGLQIANASLLDEGTAAAEAMTLCLHAQPRNRNADTFIAAADCHPQTLDILRTRSTPLGITVQVGDPASLLAQTDSKRLLGVLVQYPNSDGLVQDFSALAEQTHQLGGLFVVATDLLALTLLRAPGEFGADIAIGNSQRFGVPMGFGGPHAAFFACKDDHKRIMPGRLIGVSLDSHGNPGLRLTLQTREQHIRRDKATSNICTAQVLLAVMASMYAVYHGPNGLKQIAQRTRAITLALADQLAQAGYRLAHTTFFDTLKISGGKQSQSEIQTAAVAQRINLRYYTDGSVGISLDESITQADLEKLGLVFGLERQVNWGQVVNAMQADFAAPHARSSNYLTHPVFNSYHSESKMLRYIHTLQSRDLTLTHSMIPLGSCTMKLNATTEMEAITWPEFAELHPFVPADQALGYANLVERLSDWLGEITGLPGVSLQPNAGSQGEYAGLLAIRGYHQANGQGHRHICLIPSSAHGTNPASAAMAGMTIVVVKCDEHGNVDVPDLRAKAEQHATNLSALMITYPSTHGVFEAAITDICAIIHQHGGQVYLDGANMNAQVGLCRPGDMGADVCHLNLHKTFCIPHGGGGPGVGPICVAPHLIPHLPGHVVAGGLRPDGAVSAAPYGSAAILPISYAYIRMMGAEGLRLATQIAILNANYIAERLQTHYPVLYRGANGRVAHECIIDLRPLKHETGVEAEDVAKRLMDYGFHAPTMSFPVPGTLMIEPTESEDLGEIDRLCDALIAIRAEIAAIESGEMDQFNNPLKNAPHTAAAVTASEWNHPYSREQAAYPLLWLRDRKFWPSVGRVDNVYGDRNLFCTCVPLAGIG